MDFDTLDSLMRVFETAHDHCVIPGIYLVARLDGRGFTRLTKEVLPLETPFDVRMRDHLVATTTHLMDCGMRIIYGYTQSDEISLLFHRDDDSFQRKERKLNSLLASEATAAFVLRVQTHAAFDCRISQLPDQRRVVDYFRWRQEDAARNALSAHCYWALRKEGVSPAIAASMLSGLSTSAKNELLFARQINFNDLPAWQKRGVGVRWMQVAKTGLNPLTGQQVSSVRRRLTPDEQLPLRDDYSQYLSQLMEDAHRET